MAVIDWLPSIQIQRKISGEKLGGPDSQGVRIDRVFGIGRCRLGAITELILTAISILGECGEVLALQ